MKIAESNPAIGHIVRHRIRTFRGLYSTKSRPIPDEWYQSISPTKGPERSCLSPVAENPENYYVAYVSEQNLLKTAIMGLLVILRLHYVYCPTDVFTVKATIA